MQIANLEIAIYNTYCAGGVYFVESGKQRPHIVAICILFCMDIRRNPLLNIGHCIVYIRLAYLVHLFRANSRFGPYNIAGYGYQNIE